MIRWYQRGKGITSQAWNSGRRHTKYVLANCLCHIVYYYDIVSACELVDLLSNRRTKQVLVQNTDPSNDPFLFSIWSHYLQFCSSSSVGKKSIDIQSLSEVHIGSNSRGQSVILPPNPVTCGHTYLCQPRQQRVRAAIFIRITNSSKVHVEGYWPFRVMN